MSFFLIGNFAIHLLLCLFLLSVYILPKKFNLNDSTRKYFGLLLIVYILLTLLEGAWMLGILDLQSNDLLYITTIISAFKAVLFLLLIYVILHSKHLLYLFFIFLFVLVGLPFNLHGFFWVIYALSYLLLLLLFLDITLSAHSALKKSGLYGTIHAALFLLLLIWSALGFEQSLYLSFIPDFFCLLTLRFMVGHIQENGLTSKHYTIRPWESLQSSLFFIRFFCYILAISVFMFVSVLAIHELGHAFTAQTYDCSYTKAVIYDVLNPPHTELICDFEEGTLFDPSSMITLAGLLGTLFVSLLFWVTGGQFTSRAAVLLAGYAFILSYGDLHELAVSPSIIGLTILLGVFLICLGIALLSLQYIDQHIEMVRKKRSKSIKGE